MELTVVFNTHSLSFSELEAVLRHGPWCGDVPPPIMNLETTTATATATRTFKNQYVCTIPDSQVSLVKMKPFRYSSNVLIQKPILNMWHSGEPDLPIREGPGHPDTEISGEGGRGQVSKKNFAALQASNGLKIKGGPGPPGPSPGSATVTINCPDRPGADSLCYGTKLICCETIRTWVVKRATSLFS